MNVHWMVLYNLNVFCSESCRSRHFEFHTGTKNVLFVEDHLTFMYSLALIIFVVSEKKAFEYFPKAKLYMNVHWMVLYNLKVFCSDMKFKMAATAGLSLTLEEPSNEHSCTVWL
jgi:hypothetical protein